MEKALLYVHGRNGNYREAEQYRKNCPGFDIIGVDYADDYPWIVQKQIKTVYDDLQKKYRYTGVIANSIGAYFTMLALQDRVVDVALFISPVLDMETLIMTMMQWAKVSEAELYQRREIQTNFGETLSWEYLEFVRQNPLYWDSPTEILYAQKDQLVSRETVEAFIENHNARVTVMENGEHWFHTDTQLAFLDQWMRDALSRQLLSGRRAGN